MPKSSPQPDWWGMRPAWRISRLVMHEPFGWRQVDEITLDDIRRKLANFESMTLHEIFRVAGARNHPVQVSNLCREAKEHIDMVKLVVDQIYSLRLSGEQRVWATLTENVLQLLWWDPDHQVCPSHKKHT